MNTLYPALGRVVDEVVQRQYPSLVDENDAAQMEQAYRHQTDLAREVQELVDHLGRLAMGSGSERYLKTALAIQHRTILAQIGKAVADAIVGTTDPKHSCAGRDQTGESLHPGHDGRLACKTVRGALLMSQQPLI